MEKTAKIYVSGHNGMVGSALVRRLTADGYTNIVTRSHKELDLCAQSEVDAFFSKEKPEYVFLAAARKGSVAAVKKSPADFMYDNCIMELNALHAASKNGCKKLVFIGSGCAYPGSLEPIKESAIMSAPLDSSDESYGLAKICGMKYCAYLNQQYGTDFISVIPPNLYGPNDNYHPFNSNVLAAQIRRFHEAKTESLPSVTCWGDGSPRREFLYVDDLADLCLFLVEHYSGDEPVNASVGSDIAIRELVQMVAELIGYQGEILWDTTKPNGVFRKQFDNSKVKALGWTPKTDIKEGLRMTYAWFLEHNGDLRGN